MPIYKGANQITKVYQGETEIDKVYRGASKVYGADKGTEITVSGNPLVLTNVAKEKALDTLEIMGRTEQVQLSGKNLLDENLLYTYVTQPNTGVIFTYADGAFTVDGQATKVFTGDILQKPLPIKENTTYTLSGYPPPYNANVNMGFRMQFLDKDGKFIAGVMRDTATATYSFITPSGVSAMKMTFIVRVGYPQERVSFKLMLNEGSVAYPYEPYCGGIPSPNPAYPQDIVNVNSLEVVQSGKNLWNNPPIQTLHNDKVQYAISHYEAQYPALYKLLRSFAGKRLYYSSKTQGTTSGVPIGQFRLYIPDSTHYLAFNPNSWVTFPADMSVIGNIIIYGSNNGAWSISDIMFSTIQTTDYEPYKPIHTATIDGIELTKWDKIIKRNGVWGVSKWSIKAEFYATDNWQTWGVDYQKPNITGFYCYKQVPFVADLSYSLAMYCNLSIPNPNAWGGIAIGTRYYWDSNDYLNNRYFAVSIPTDMLEDSSSNANAIASFKKILTDKKLEYIIPVDTEQSFTPLSQTIQDQLNALQIVKPTTVVTNNAECEMSATYLCYLDNAEAMLSAMYQNDLSEVLK